MNRKLQVGDKVQVFHETLKGVCYGLGTIEEVGCYFGNEPAYFVRLDRSPNSAGDYSRRQLKIVTLKKALG